jgi:hypothetical protein
MTYRAILLGRTAGRPENVAVRRSIYAANDEGAVQQARWPARQAHAWPGSAWCSSLDVVHDFQVTDGSRIVRPWANPDSQSICDSCTELEASSAVSRFARYRAPSGPAAPEVLGSRDREPKSTTS